MVHSQQYVPGAYIHNVTKKKLKFSVRICLEEILVKLIFLYKKKIEKLIYLRFHQEGNFDTII
jgi:hypothetical protein